MGRQKLVTKEFKNKANTSNHVGVKDDIGKTILEKQLGKYEDELNAYKEALSQVNKDIKNYNEQWLLDKEEMQLQYDNFGTRRNTLFRKFLIWAGFINPHKVHSINRFWEIAKIKYGYKIRQETYTAKQWLDNKAIEKQKAIDRIKIIKSNLATVKKELKV